MTRRRPTLDENATCLGILLGLCFGACYWFMRSRRRGLVARKDLSQLGAGSAEIEMQSRLSAAKAQAEARLPADDAAS